MYVLPKDAEMDSLRRELAEKMEQARTIVEVLRRGETERETLRADLDKLRAENRQLVEAQAQQQVSAVSSDERSKEIDTLRQSLTEKETELEQLRRTLKDRQSEIESLREEMGRAVDQERAKAERGYMQKREEEMRVLREQLERERDARVSILTMENQALLRNFQQISAEKAEREKDVERGEKQLRELRERVEERERSEAAKHESIVALQHQLQQVQYQLQQHQQQVRYIIYLSFSFVLPPGIPHTRLAHSTTVFCCFSPYSSFCLLPLFCPSQQQEQQQKLDVWQQQQQVSESAQQQLREQTRELGEQIQRERDAQHKLQQQLQDQTRQ